MVFLFVDGGEFASGLRVYITRPGSGIAAAAKHTEVVECVGVAWVGEGVDWSDVVDGVGFVATDGAGVVGFEELFAEPFESGVVAGLAVVLAGWLVVHGFLC